MIKPRLILKVLSLAILTLFSILFFSYHLAYARKIIPGVRVGPYDLGNKSASESATLLANFFDPLAEQSLTLKSDEQTFAVLLSEIDFAYDIRETVKRAYAVGRSQDLLADLKTEWRAWFEGVEVKPTYKIDQEKLSSKLIQIGLTLDDPPQDAAFAVEDGELTISEAKSGRVVDREGLKEMIATSLSNLTFGEIEIPLIEVTPTVTAADLETVKPQVETLLANPPKLVYQGRAWIPKVEDLLAFVKVSKCQGVNASECQSVKVEIDEVLLADYVATIAFQVNRPPRGGVFQIEGERVAEFHLASDGLQLDQEQTKNLLTEALLGQEAARTINLPVTITPVPQDVNEYGIQHLLGEGVSNFAGSPRGRIHNIQTAAARLNGILVPPGEIFSFNNSLGKVSRETGYDTALIIKEGRTVLGAGGGVCQVSTTLFRAALYSGLPILKRTAHAFRVSYYEPPVGFDATVYDPSPDLVFQNDTSGHILIQSFVDTSRTTLTFRIFGTSDGRVTKISGPYMGKQTPPPPPLYQEDPSLARGVTKQLERAVWGADVTVGRTVTRGSETLQNDTFRSHYQAWRAVYLVGTKE